MAFIVAAKMLIFFFQNSQKNCEMHMEYALCVVFNEINVFLSALKISTINFGKANPNMKVVKVRRKPYKSPKCHIRFEDKKNIPRHIKNIHGKQNEKLQCIICKKMYSTKGNYDHHFEKKHVFESVFGG